MTIEELADVLGKNLIIKRYANQTNRYTAQFEHCETKESSHDPTLLGEYGNAVSAVGAIDNYAQKIRGKILVFNAYSDDRKTFGVPKTLKGITNEAKREV